jgi:hypothetical protein
MKIPTRNNLGGALLVISLLLALNLYLSGTPLLSLQELQNYSSPDGSFTVAQLRMRWPLLAICASALFGLLAFVWPKPKPPKLQP